MNPLAIFYMTTTAILGSNTHSAASYVRRRSIHTSHRKSDSKRGRSLQTNNCLGDLYQGNNLVCTSNDIEITTVSGSTVHDAGSYEDGGVWKGVCAEADDYVSLSFNVTMEVKNQRYDVGM